MRTKQHQQTLRRVISAILFGLMTILPLSAQSVLDIIEKHPAYASCNYDTYPDSIDYPTTQAPKGKRPFYISHNGRHGSRYISNRKGFDIPFTMML